MWKRDQAAQPAPAPSPAAPSQGVPAPSPSPAAPAAVNAPQPYVRNETHMVNIGKSVVIKGDLQGSEDLTIEGHVEGTIDLKQNVLTIGPNGRINARVSAKMVIIQGTVNGNVTASEKVDIRDGASVDGDVSAPRIAIAEGAQFHGSVDMQPAAKRTQPAAAAGAGAKPAVISPAVAAATH